MGVRYAVRPSREYPAAEPVLRSGPIEVRPATRELMIDGRLASIERRAFDLLVYLMRHADRVVDKDELWCEVWQSRPVSESTLPQAVSRVRRALGGPDPEACVATVYGVGYRFVLPVEVVPSSAPQNAWQASVRLSEALGMASLRRHSIMASLLLVIAAGAVWWLWLMPSVQATPRIALLPVQIDSSDPDLEWVRFGALPLIDRTLADAGVARLDPGTMLATLERYPELVDPEGQARILRLSSGVDRVIAPRLLREDGSFRLELRYVGDPEASWSASLAGDDVSMLAVAAGERISRSLSESLARWQGAQRARRSLVTDDAFVNEAFMRGLDARLRGRFEDAARFFETVIAAAPGLHEAKFHLSLVTRRLGRWDVTERLHRELLVTAESEGDIDMVAAVQSVSGTLAWRRGEPQEARRWYESALANYSLRGNADYVASVTSNLGILAATQGDYATAEAHFRAALEHYSQTGDSYNQATTLKNLGNLASDQGRYEDAQAALREALAIRQELDLPLEVALTLSVLGDIAMARGRWNNALAYQEQVLAAAQQYRSPVMEAQAYADLAGALRRIGRLEDARLMASRAHAVATALGNPSSEARALLEQGRAESDLGNFARAAELLRQATDVYTRIDQPLGRAFGLLALADCELAAARPEAAEAAVAALVTITSETPIPRIEAGMARIRAEIAAFRGDVDAAIVEMARAYALARAGETIIDAVDIGGRLGSMILGSRPDDHRLAELAKALAADAHASVDALAFLSRYQRTVDPALALDLAERRKRLAGERWNGRDEAELESLSRALDSPAR